MSNIQLYPTDIDIETQGTNNNKILSVYIKGVDASDFVSEFTVDEILSAMEFSDVFDWAIKMKGEDDYED